MQQTTVKAAVGRSREELYPLSSVRSPHIWPRSAGGLSGRPFGRIFPMNGVWLLELDPMSGGLVAPRGRGARQYAASGLPKLDGRHRLRGTARDRLSRGDAAAPAGRFKQSQTCARRPAKILVGPAGT